MKRVTLHFTTPHSTGTVYAVIVCLSIARRYCIQDCIYQTPVRDVTDLKQHLTDTWNELQHSIVDNAVDEWQKRLVVCVKEKEDISYICYNN